MPPKPATEIGDACARRAKWLNWYTKRMVQRGLPLADLNQVFSGAFVSFYAFYERQIEDLFVGILSGRYTHADPAVSPLLTFPSQEVAQKVVFAGRSYADWLPYDRHLKGRAKIFYADGHPFCGVTPQHKSALEDLSVMRNALAHQSKHSLKVFQERFIVGEALPPSQQTPTGYLRGNVALGQTRLEFFLSQSVSVVREFSG